MTETRDLIAESRASFVEHTAEHKMTVLRDDGLYRHLRFQKPSTSIYYFDLVTWPGYLAIVGDSGDFVFARTRDMFEFFTSGVSRDFTQARINPHYWSEKLQAPRHDAARRFSHEVFKEQVAEWFASVAQDLDDDAAAALSEALEDRVLADWLMPSSEWEAHDLLRNFEHEIRIGDAWEWDLRDWDFRFLWCCWAIVWGIGVYRAQDKDYNARQETRAYLLARPEFEAA